LRSLLVARQGGKYFLAVVSRGPGSPERRQFALIVDEWESVEQFQQFFADPELQAFIATTGASPEPPQIIVAEALAVTQF
jgi:hypothetical protein